MKYICMHSCMISSNEFISYSSMMLVALVTLLVHVHAMLIMFLVMKNPVELHLLH